MRSHQSFECRGEKARNILENSEGIQPITVSFSIFEEIRDLFHAFFLFSTFFRSRQM